MSRKIGFIGCGNMGTAMIQGILDAGHYGKEDVIAAEKSGDMRLAKKELLGIEICEDNGKVAEWADILILSIKPQFYEEVIKEIRDRVRPETVIVTIAPGKTIQWLEEIFGGSRKLIRTMPNTPAMVKEGMMGMCPNQNVTPEELALVRELCQGFSRTEVVAENLLDVVTAVSGSSPAYVFMFIEAMADGAVAGGMSRDQAYTFAAQAVLGSAKMVLETGKHPGELKDMVCSPAGTTIQAVRVLEDKGMRSAVFEAVEKCLEVSRGM